ncbi:hypothetical protein ACIBG8_54645 [Nonomuraea sp. NPDC050556]|uniref:hypothetical protein n=1 Tax=Nonomuraea sp. NPDC050556 TaxID=3364369 RepID=UPI00379A1D2C
MAGVLGCAEAYQIVAHWRGGERQFGAISGVTALTWGRRLDKTSTCTLEITKGEADPACVNGVLDKLAEWVHEVTVYRDGKVVWQGPVTSIDERRTTVTVLARDVVGWLDRRINWVELKKQTADGTVIAESYIRQAFARWTEPGTSTSYSTDPNVLEFLKVYNGAPKAKVERFLPRSAYYGTLLRNLTKQGMDFTCVGRRIIIMPEATSKTRAQARLTDADFSQEISVLSDGMAIATRATITWIWTPEESSASAAVLGVRAGRLVGAAEVRPVDGDQEEIEPAGDYPWDGTVADRSTPEAMLGAAKGEMFKKADADGSSAYGRWFAERTGDAEWAVEPWAFTFLSWCAEQSGNAGAFPAAGDGQQLAEAMRADGRWSDDPAQGARGALAFFDLDGDGVVDHGGVVARLRDDGRLELVEGDTGGKVALRVRSTDGLAGYGYPAYENVAVRPMVSAAVRAAAKDKRVSRSVSGIRRADVKVWNFLDAMQDFQTEPKESAYALYRPKLTSLLTQTDPPRPTVQVPDGAFLLPTAPITIEQLVPGVRVDIALNGYQRAAMAGLRLSDVEVTWKPGEAERVSVAFAPLRGQETPPDVWDETGSGT